MLKQQVLETETIGFAMRQMMFLQIAFTFRRMKKPERHPLRWFSGLNKS